MNIDHASFLLCIGAILDQEKHLRSEADKAHSHYVTTKVDRVRAFTRLVAQLPGSADRFLLANQGAEAFELPKESMTKEINLQRQRFLSNAKSNKRGSDDE